MGGAAGVRADADGVEGVGAGAIFFPPAFEEALPEGPAAALPLPPLIPVTLLLLLFPSATDSRLENAPTALLPPPGPPPPPPRSDGDVLSALICWYKASSGGKSSPYIDNPARCLAAAAPPPPSLTFAVVGIGAATPLPAAAGAPAPPFAFTGPPSLPVALLPFTCLGPYPCALALALG